MSKIRLPRVEEPLWYKRIYREHKVKTPKLARADIKQGTWFLKPYWGHFKDYFKSLGITWQTLMEAWGDSNIYFVQWAEGKITWEEAFNKFEEALNRLIKWRNEMLMKEAQKLLKIMKTSDWRQLKKKWEEISKC